MTLEKILYTMWEEEKVMEDKMEKEIIVYTDGGARGNGKEDCVSAWAYTLSCGDHHKEAKAAMYGATNNQMEMTAIIEALKAIKNKKLPIRVHSDSAYCINGITSWIHSWKKKGWVNSKKEPVENKELWIEMDKLVSECSVHKGKRPCRCDWQYSCRSACKFSYG